MTNQIYWILKASINEGKKGELQGLAKQFCELTEKEEGVVAYEWSINDDMLHIYERYANSDEALSHTANIGSLLPELIELVTPTEIECYGAASDAFKEAFKDVPMVYFDTFAGFHR